MPAVPKPGPSRQKSRARARIKERKNAKATVWATRPHFCEVCGKGPYRRSDVEIHHKVKLSQGGEDTPDNLLIECRVCHGSAHNIKVIVDSPLKWSKGDGNSTS